MAKTNSGLVAYARAQVGLPYWYGTYGQTASESLYTAKKKQYPSYYTASDFASQYGKRVHDCVGLIKGYLWSDSATGTPTYNSAQDKSARGMYAAATTKGKIATFPGTAGLLLFKGSSTGAITHVGIYGGDGYVYEAKGHAYGTLRTVYKASDWPYWAQCPYCTDDTGDTGDAGETIDNDSAATDTQEEEMITYEQWKEYMNQYHAERQDNDSGDWSEEARQWCIDNGIFLGDGADGTPNYMWEDFLSREQAAVLLYRLAQKLGAQGN
ncbi:MAG: hypothetical protein LUD79_06655 [Oscillospiraceae bacterium]|nr:hypothetical protein [Oscillospiraceae bacterium]